MSKFTTEVRYICQTKAGYDESGSFTFPYLEVGTDEIAGSNIVYLAEAGGAVADLNKYKLVGKRVKIGDYPESYLIISQYDNYIVVNPVLQHTIEDGLILRLASGEEPNIDDILLISAPKIFDFDYPIFDESYRIPLETKILKHYYTREISEETVGLWKLRLNDRMNMIMPYYNELYKSAAKEFNPFYDIDLSTTHAKSNTNNEENETSTNEISYGARSENRDESGENDNVNNDTSVNSSSFTNNGTDTVVSGETTERRDLYSDTPQGGLTGLDDEEYLTNARKINDVNNREVNGSNTQKGSENNINDSVSKTNTNYTNNVEGNTVYNDYKNGGIKGVIDITSNEAFTEKIIGKRGSASYSSLLLEFRKTFINIDAMVVEELNDLFFGLWG